MRPALRIDRGFALVELVVVFIMVVLLVTVLSCTQPKVQQTSGASVCRTNMRTLSAATLPYMNDHQGLAPNYWVMPMPISSDTYNEGYWEGILIRQGTMSMASTRCTNPNGFLGCSTEGL